MIPENLRQDIEEEWCAVYPSLLYMYLDFRGYHINTKLLLDNPQNADVIFIPIKEKLKNAVTNFIFEN